MTTRTPKAVQIDEALRYRIETIACAAHPDVYLVSFLERPRYSARTEGTVRIDVAMNAKIAGRRAQVWLGLFEKLCAMSDADLVARVQTKIARKEARLCQN